MTGMTKFFLAGAALAAAALAGSGAWSQPASALKGHDTNAPVDVAADRIEVQDRADRVIFSGNVDVRQGQLQLAAPRITVTYSEAGGIQIERLEASGGVRLRSPTESAQAQFAVYDTDQRIITMMGGVVLNQGPNVIRGGRLVLELETGRAVMEGAGPPGVENNGGRVTGRFTVPQRTS